MEVTKPVTRVRCGDRFTNGDRVFGVTQVGGRFAPVTVITGRINDLTYTEYPHDAKVVVQERSIDGQM